MTTVFLDINDINDIYIVKTFPYNITTKSYKIDTEKLETWEKAPFFALQSLQILHLLKVSSKNILQRI